MRKYFNMTVIILMLAISVSYGKSDESEEKNQISGEALTNGLVFVKGGTFLMGNNGSDGNEEERPVHEVTVIDFYISKYEITQSEWGKHMPAFYYDSGEGSNYPVYYVSWYEVLKYSNKRSIAEGLNPCYSINGSTDPDIWGASPATADENWDAVVCNWKANGYRMPTEAEWEYASRGGDKAQGLKFSGSNDHLKVAWMEENSGIKLHEVGRKQANELGLYDMSGNLYEWCWDWYGEYPDSALTNPTGPATGKFRVERGGAWDRGVNASKVDSRYFFKPQTSYGGVGVRIARTH